MLLPKRVAVTGVGIVSCLGLGAGAVTEALRAGRSGIVLDEERRALGFRSPLTGRLPELDPAAFLRRKQRKTMPDFAQHAYIAVREALTMADIADEALRNPRSGMIFGCDSSCLAAVEQVDLLKQYGETHKLGSGLVFKAMNSAITMNLNVLLGTQGANWTISSACSSSAHAVGQAAELIAAGRQDRVICGGAQEINWQSMCSFDALGAFSRRLDDPEAASRPFDAERDGLVPSGGAAALILENFALARERGAEILGEVTGYGFSSDGANLSVPDISGLARAMSMALQDAGKSPGDVDLLLAHATSTPAGDAAEAENIRRIFAGHRPPVTALKSLTGHELWMAGAANVVYATLMARAGFVAPTRNFSTPDAACAGLDIVTECRAHKPVAVLSNAAGFGGSNAALLLARFGYRVAVLEKAPRPAPLIAGFSRDGCYFDSGFHYAGGLEPGANLDLSLRFLGLDPDLGPATEAVADTVLEEQSSFTFPSGYRDLEESLGRDFPAEKAALKNYFLELRRILEKLPYYAFPGREFAARITAFPEDETSLAHHLAVFSPGLRRRLALHCLLHGVVPAEIPFPLHAAVVDGYYSGARTFVGGGRALARAYEAALQKAGVEVFCRAEVRALELTAAGAMAGVGCADGRRFSATGCIATLDPRLLPALLPAGALRPAYRKRLEKLRGSIGAEMVFLKSATAQAGRGRNFFLLPPPQAELFGLDTGLVSGLDQRFLYLNVAVAEAGAAAGLTAILPAAPGSPAGVADAEQAYISYKRELADQVCRRLQKSLPELCADLEVVTVATGRTLARYCGGGSLYGVAHCLGQFNPTARTRVAGLLLAGQACAAPGLMGAVISAFLAVGEIVGHQRLLAERRKFFYE